ncbi:MAG: hypothetical protein KKC19_01080 [Nanoarchaeota archaeon]|nr:hypothetical protein [Nanoarchaeota archaeon]
MEIMSLEKMNEEIIALKMQLEQMKESFREDMGFAIRTELAWQEVDKGEVNSYSKDEFLQRLEEW